MIVKGTIFVLNSVASISWLVKWKKVGFNFRIRFKNNISLYLNQECQTRGLLVATLYVGNCA